MKKYLRLGISTVLLAIIAWRTDWDSVHAIFAKLRVEWWFAAAGLFAFAQLVSARRWQLYARELQFDRPLSHFCAYYFVGMYFNLVLPSSVGGDVMRVVYLNAQSGRKWPAFVSVLLERLSGLIVLIALACVGVLLGPRDLPGWMAASVWGIALGGVVGVASLPFLTRWSRVPLARREQLATILDLLRSPSLLLETSLLSMLTQLSGVLIVWCLGVGLGLDVPFSYCCVMAPLVTLLTFLPLSVNGMGIREGATVLFLAPLGVEPAAAVSLAFLWFSVGAAISLVGGVCYLWGGSLETSRRPETVR